MTLAVVDYTATPGPATGIGNPTIRLTVPTSAAPGYIQTSAVTSSPDHLYRIIDSPANPLDATLTVTNVNYDWFFAPSVVVTTGGVAAPAVNMVRTANTNNWTTPDIAIQAGGDVVVTVTIRARALQAFITDVEDIDYGEHTLNIAGQTVRLGVTAGTVTSRGDIEFTVFDGLRAGWHLQAESNQIGTYGLYRVLYMENAALAAPSIDGNPSTVFSHTHVAGSNPIFTFDWNTPGAHGIEVRTGTTNYIIGEHKAEIVWTLVPLGSLGP